MDVPKFNPPVQLFALPPGGKRERADAARNRERILREARQLFRERGVQHVSMEEIASAAGVGKGTLYRRFSDRGSIALALLEADHIDLQESFIRGDPPLGPGAPSRERLRAFLTALSRHLERHRDLIAEAERSTPAGQRYTWGVYTAWHTHVRILLDELNPTLDNDVLAHILLAPVRGEIFQQLTEHSGAPGRERLLAALDLLIDGIEAHVNAS